MPPVKNAIPSNPRSKVWRHFGNSQDGEYAQCLICKESKTIAIHIKVRGGSTQALRNHIKYHHKKEFRDMEKEEADESKEKEKEKLDDSETGSPPKKLTVTEMLKRKISAKMSESQGASGGGRSRATLSQVFSSQQKSNFKKECDSYELLPYADSGVDQLLWWKDHSSLTL